MEENQIKELIRQTIREDIKKQSLKEVGTHDWRYTAIKKMWDRGSSFARKKIAAAITKNPNSQWSKIDDYLKDMDYEEIVDAGEMLHLENINEIKLNDLVGKTYNYQIGSSTEKKYRDNDKEYVLGKIAEILKHNLYDYDFASNYLDSSNKTKYKLFFENEILAPMLKKVDYTLNKFFILQNDTIKWKLSAKDSQKIVDDMFIKNSKIPADIKKEYYEYRDEYAGVKLKESIKEETASDIIKDLDKLRHDLIKKVDVLIAKKKKLYSNVDITTPMSADEKKLDKDIADLFSQIQQIIRQKRTIKESVNEEKSFTPEKRREPKVGEIEIMKGKGNRQTWFYVDNEDDAKRLVRMGRNSAFPTGITKNKSKVKFDKAYMIDESVNEELPHQKEMVDGIVDMLNQVEDLDNRKEMAIDQLKNFKEENISVNPKEFLQKCGLTESKFNGNLSGDAAEYIAKELSHYVKGIIDQPNRKSTYLHLKDKSYKGKVIKTLKDVYGLDAKDGGILFSPSPTVVFSNNEILESKINESPESLQKELEYQLKWAYTRFKQNPKDSRYEKVVKDTIDKLKQLRKTGKLEGTEKIAGGLAQNKSLNDIAKKHDISIDLLVGEFKKGISTEMEHTNSREIAKEIALDHLMEDPHYYTKLAQIEPVKEDLGGMAVKLIVAPLAAALIGGLGKYIGGEIKQWWRNTKHKREFNQIIDRLKKDPEVVAAAKKPKSDFNKLILSKLKPAEQKFAEFIYKREFQKENMNEVVVTLPQDFIHAVLSSGLSGWQMAGILLLDMLLTMGATGVVILSSIGLYDAAIKLKKAIEYWNASRKINKSTINQIISDYESKLNKLKGGERKFFLGLINKLKKSGLKDKQTSVQVKKDLDYYSYHYGLDKNEGIKEAFTKGQLYKGTLKLGGNKVEVEVELVGADNKTKEFITKVIHIDKQHQSKLPIGSTLPIPARIFRFAGDWRKIKTPSVFEYIDDKGEERVAAALPQTEEEPQKKIQPTK